MDDYPWVFKPLQQWTWDDVRREMERFGVVEIDEYVVAGGCSLTKDPEEYLRRWAVFLYALEENKEVFEELYAFHKLNVAQKKALNS